MAHRTAHSTTEQAPFESTNEEADFTSLWSALEVPDYATLCATNTAAYRPALSMDHRTAHDTTQQAA